MSSGPLVQCLAGARSFIRKDGVRRLSQVRMTDTGAQGLPKLQVFSNVESVALAVPQLWRPPEFRMQEK